MGKKQKISPQVKTAQEFINVEDISENLIFSDDGYVFGFLYARGCDDKLMSSNEREIYWNNVTKALEIEKNAFQIISIPRIVDISGMISHLSQLKKQTNEDAKLRLIDGEIDAMQKMLRLGSKEPLIVIKIWEKAVKRVDTIINKRLSDLSQSLSQYKITTERLDDQDIVFICKTFADLSEYQSLDEIVDGEDLMPVIKNQKKNLNLEVQRQSLIRNMITPIGGIKFSNNKILLGSTICRVYGATKYASELAPAWAVNIMNNTDCITAITFYPQSGNELATALSASINKNLIDSQSTRDARMRKSLEREAVSADNLITRLDEKKETIGLMNIISIPFHSNEEKFEDVCRNVVNMFSRQKIKLRPLGIMQKEGLQSVLPYYSQPDIIQSMLNQITPLKTLVGGSPMTVNIHRDDHGCYFAKTKDGTLMTLDLSYRGNDRTNSNIVILGSAGTGKSTTVKHIMQTAFMNGYKVIVIDPEREFADLCKALGGSWLDTGGGKNKINPLQIRPVPTDDDDDLYIEKDNALVMHMKTLDIFFSLYVPSLTDIQKALLKKTVIELYDDFGITWDTDISDMPSDSFPRFTDLYAKLELKAKEDNRFDDLSSLFYDIANGADSFLWNEHTNIDTDNSFICFDTNKLNNAGDDIKRTQYFNILTLAWEMMSRERDKDVLLVCDEAYLMIDPNIPQSLMYLRNIEKRCRKYSGALAVISHSIVDFLDPKIKMYGQALLDIPTYKIFFGMDGKNLKELVELYDLTEEEQNILSAKIRGEALCMIGSNRIHTVFDIPEYKLDLMGKGGGR